MCELIQPVDCYTKNYLLKFLKQKQLQSDAQNQKRSAKYETQKKSSSIKLHKVIGKLQFHKYIMENMPI